MTPNKNLIHTLKERWGINSTGQVIIILIGFSCTGFSVLYAEALIYSLLNIPTNLEWYYSITLFLLITLPLYNVLLLIYGFLFGQFRFFWNFEKRFFSRILNALQSKSANK